MQDGDDATHNALPTNVTTRAPPSVALLTTLM
jgi:hypothetical protein